MSSCSSDWSAHGALDELRDRKIRVPEDVAVIGFEIWTSGGFRPSLTTVKIDGGMITPGRRFLTPRRKIDRPVIDWILADRPRQR